MTDRMKRFLLSMGIENIDNYDIDFVSCKKSEFEKDLFVFDISKETLWDYQSLDVFLRATMNIQYRCELNYIYKEELSQSYLERFIGDIYFNKTYETLKATYQFTYNEFLVKFKDKKDYEKFNKVLNEIKLLFQTIEYNVEVRGVVEKEEEIATNNFDLAKDIEDEEQKAIENAIAQAKENYNKMLEERRHQDVFKRGGYEFKEIAEIDSNSGPIDFNGYIFECEVKDTRKGKKIAKVGIANEFTTSAIYVTIIEGRTIPAEAFIDLKVGKNIRIKGRVDLDKFKRDIYVMCHYFYMLPDNPLRDDNAVNKRVELHLHTKMSEMDSVSTITDYCKLAKHMGHKAIAVTDHGNVQAFPEAQSAAKKFGIKMLYGCEVYLIDDYFYGAKNPSQIPLKDATYVCFDFETTGLSIKYDRITEFGAVKIKDGLVVDRLDILINPEMHIPEKIAEKTKIDDELVKNCRTIKEELPRILKFMEGTVIVSHNIEFDYGMLNEACEREGFGTISFPSIDTLALSRYLFPENAYHSLGALCKRYEVSYDSDSAHRADYDAEVLANVWLSMRTNLTKNNPNLLHKDLYELPMDKKALKHLRSYHATVIAKNRKGLKDLYKIVSAAHVDYMGSQPLVPKHILNEFREDLLVGSSCMNSEVFYSSTNRSMKQLEEVMKKYDYIEIQPLENYSYLVNMGNVPNTDMLKRYVLDIINTAKKLGKMIVATGDAHYRDPKDKVFRDVYINNQAVGGINHPLMPFARIKMQENGEFFDNPSQHFRTTEEMLDAFKWLGEEEANEYVITNTNKIADLCEEIIPIPDKLFTPTIDNCENLLRNLCFKTANELYGDIEHSDDEAKIFIRDRLETELDGIISNGFSVIYYIAHQLVKKSNEDG